METIVETHLDLPLYFRGKVRDLYDLGDKLLIIATDRISCFDYVLPTAIPNKGKLLTQITLFWLKYLRIPNHFITSDVSMYPPELQQYKDILEQRSMLVKKAKRINIECIVRGYLAGSAWEEYKDTGYVCGIKLKKNLEKCAKLDEPIFTPAIKSQTGHDVNISEQEVIINIGQETTEKIKKLTLDIYKKAAKYAENCGLILVDSKFEFGWVENDIVLIDEVLTPDSSRYWDKDKYTLGTNQESYDKQFVRDYLLRINWNKEPPVPTLPEDVVQKTVQKYEELYNRLVGK